MTYRYIVVYLKDSYKEVITHVAVEVLVQSVTEFPAHVIVNLNNLTNDESDS